MKCLSLYRRDGTCVYREPDVGFETCAWKQLHGITTLLGTCLHHHERNAPRNVSRFVTSLDSWWSNAWPEEFWTLAGTQQRGRFPIEKRTPEAAIEPRGYRYTVHVREEIRAMCCRLRGCLHSFTPLAWAQLMVSWVWLLVVVNTSNTHLFLKLKFQQVIRAASPEVGLAQFSDSRPRVCKCYARFQQRYLRWVTFANCWTTNWYGAPWHCFPVRPLPSSSSTPQVE